MIMIAKNGNPKIKYRTSKARLGGGITVGRYCRMIQYGVTCSDKEAKNKFTMLNQIGRLWV